MSKKTREIIVDVPELGWDYAPQEFAKIFEADDGSFDVAPHTGMSEEQWRVLLAGPDVEDEVKYWEVWDQVWGDFRWYDEGGSTLCLYVDEDNATIEIGPLL
jgi:hypothetical protein